MIIYNDGYSFEYVAKVMGVHLLMRTAITCLVFLITCKNGDHIARRQDSVNSSQRVPR
jgi:hypothetical protein